MTNYRYITEAEVGNILKPAAVTDALEEAFRQLARGEAVLRPRDRAVLGHHVQHTLAAISQGWGLSAVKTYLTGPAGVSFVTLLFSLAESRLLATIESARLGQLRTGCATALAARHLTHGPQKLALFGGGTVGKGQLEALQAELGGRLESIAVYSRKPEVREAFAKDMSVLLGREVRACASPQVCLEGANLVVTATSSKEPVFSHNDLGPSGLLCAVGGNWAFKREIDAATVEHCHSWWVDDLDQARVEAGELLQWDGFPWDRCGTLAQLVSTPTGDASGSGWVLFKSLGVGLEDLAAARLLCL